MHRIAQGPDGSMWFTSNQADALSTITTSTSGLPVYGYKTEKMQSSYLTALPQELIKHDLNNDRLTNLDPLFLSSVKNKQSVQHIVSAMPSQVQPCGVWIAMKSRNGRDRIVTAWKAGISVCIATLTMLMAWCRSMKPTISRRMCVVGAPMPMISAIPTPAATSPVDSLLLVSPNPVTAC